MENSMFFSKNNLLRMCGTAIDILILSPLVTLVLLLIGILITGSAIGPGISIFIPAPFVIMGSYVIGLVAAIDEALFRDNTEILLLSIPIIAIPTSLLLLAKFLKSGFIKLLFIAVLNVVLLICTLSGAVDSTSAFAYLVLLAINIVLSVFECTLKGRTIGKYMLGINMISKNNVKLTFGDYLYRAYLKNLGLFLWPLSFLYFLIRKETPWDTVCKTKVTSVYR